MLHIIFRTCNKSVKNRNENSNKDVRICGDDRVLLIKKCLYSVIQSANSSGYEYEITVLDDNSTDDFIQTISNILEKANAPKKIVRLTEEGYNYSAYMQFLYAKQSKDLFYTVEDDYLHTPNAIKELIEAYKFIEMASSELTPPKEIILFPWDCHHRYGISDGKYVENPLINIPCSISYINGRFWRTTYATTNTIFSKSSVIRNHFYEFEKLSKEYPNVTEDNTINKLYLKDSNFLPDPNTPINVYSPIPSLAYHVSYEPIPSVNSEGCDWTKLWENISEEDLK